MTDKITHHMESSRLEQVISMECLKIYGLSYSRKHFSCSFSLQKFIKDLIGDEPVKA